MKQEIEQFMADNPDVNEVDLIILDIPGNFYGKRYAIQELPKLAEKGLKFPRGMPLMSVQGHTIDALGHGIEDGDPDAEIALIPGSLKRVSWESEPRAQVMVSYVQGNEDSPFWEPRNILKRVLQRFADDDISPVVAYELEFYLFDQQRTDEGLVQPAVGPRSNQRDSYAVLSMDRLADFGDCLSDITRTCAEQGVAVGPISAEVGLGQYEINLLHNADVMAAADQCVLFKRIVKGVAMKHGFQASFIAKPYLDHAGNGLHLHTSFYDKDGKNIFAEPSAESGDSKLKHAIGGILALMPDSLSIFAPNLNAFRRLTPHNNVPVSPTWGYENRSVAARVPSSDDNNRRIEYRVGGADANPYLALASLLAAIHWGMAQKSDPGAPRDDLCTEASGLPTDFRQALRQTEASTVLKSYLGEDFIPVYCAQKRSEVREFEDAISSREYDWYL
ncbi:MAG: glutamine synthetase [Proteobacteria bacterium]|nr:MAG: glutamine synthetase [Pseudomonadota bacterium]